MVGAVTVALLAGTLLFIVWLAGLSNKATKCYDIYFAQGVGGLNKGSNVSFSGVPVGQVQKISLLPNRPEFVWVRVEVDDQTPVLQGTSAQIKIASHNAGLAANNVAALTDNTNRLVNEQGRPAIENLNKTIISARQAADNLNAMITDARPGVQNFTKSTLPEANKLVHDLRDLSQALQQVSNRVNQQGIGGTLGPEKLPDYKPGKRK